MLSLFLSLLLTNSLKHKSEAPSTFFPSLWVQLLSLDWQAIQWATDYRAGATGRAWARRIRNWSRKLLRICAKILNFRVRSILISPFCAVLTLSNKNSWEHLGCNYFVNFKLPWRLWRWIEHGAVHRLRKGRIYLSVPELIFDRGGNQRVVQVLHGRMPWWCDNQRSI